nr:hypothetical protein [Microvirga massiliensis]
MGLGPIPFTAIDAYARRYRIDDVDEFDRFITLVKVQDSEYLRLRQRQDDENLVDEVEATDVEGVRALMKRLGNRHSPEKTDDAHGITD